MRLKAFCLTVIILMPCTVNAWFWDKADVVLFAQQVTMDAPNRNYYALYALEQLGGDARSLFYAQLVRHRDTYEVRLRCNAKNRGTRNAHLVKIGIDHQDTNVPQLPDSISLMSRNRWYSRLKDWTLQIVKQGETAEESFCVLIGLFDTPPKLADYPSIARMKLKIISYESEP